MLKNLGKWNIEKFWEILGDFAALYVLSCVEKLSPKSTFVEKKMTNMRSAIGKPQMHNNAKPWEL